MIKQFEELHGVNIAPMKIMCDSKSTIATIRNEKDDGLKLYLGTKCQRVRQHLEEGKITLEYVQTKLQLADGLTKAANSNVYKHLRESVLKRPGDTGECWTTTHTE